jgi:flavin-dependent dehydrogenase
MNCELHDVVVVGAGPLRSTAAYEIAKAGYDVLLLERDKVPGSSIPAAAAWVISC